MKKDLPKIDEHNFPIIFKHLTYFIKDEVLKTGVNRVVLGLSGGVDSAAACYLASGALGKDNVTALLMPYKSSSKSSLEDALKVVEALGISHYIIDITKQVDGYFQAEKDGTPVNDIKIRMGNKMSRERMSILYDYSYKLKSLVLGTSNKSELLLGYGTIYGDMASALNPIGDIYKTQIYQLAKLLGIPDSIMAKPPSADLWLGQSDESELGFTYEAADSIMYLLIDKMYKPEVVVSLGYDAGIVNAVYNKIKKSQYKRRMPLIAKVSERTINIDFRYLRDWS
ncbi:MAG: NAD+ synthase [Deltaproteobacteria bacterium]|jgi:NAD+ synthase|nr:NAD+ synthase [Deltaproteobacteria bacterium]MCL5880499.1 NAD+ synthase [Deltaproteobacteria bacterium]MDA8304680.1 NAD+ synthase [Deltaproteobacteria bacterium]